MRALIVTLGSRGDVQPFIALGMALRDRGHEVSLCTPDRFESFVTDHGLGFLPADGGFIDLLESEEGKQLIEELRSLWGTLKASARLMRRVRELIGSFLEDAWTRARDFQPDLLVLGSKGIMGSAIAARLGIPAALVMPLPQLVPHGDFPVVGFPRLPFGPAYNRATHRFVLLMTGFYARMLEDFRTNTLDLPPARGVAGLLADLDGRPWPILHCYSPQLVPRPREWPDHASVDGFWFLDRDADWQPPEELLRFLDAGTAPVCIGFGSMAGRFPEQVTTAALDAVKAAGIRAILLTGWGGLQAGDLPSSIHATDQVPHDWLFERCSAVVHHGGAGTTGAGLRAGLPTLICPFGLDQPFWGQRVHALGVGPEPVPQRQLRRRGIAAELADLVGNDGYRERARALAERIAGDPGPADVARRLETLQRTWPYP
ncbi:MAG: glycosyltransferase [Pseudomonadota bacterium]